MRRSAPLLHLAFAFGPLVGFVAIESSLARAVFGGLVFVSVFAFTHDAMHRALGVPRWANEAALSIGGLLMGVSGSAARTLHLVHHARPGAVDDFEGKTLGMTLLRALFVSPLGFFEMPFRAARASNRRRQIVEWFFVLVILAVSVAWGGAPRAYALVCFAAQCTVQVWASHVPHRAPRALMTFAKALVWTRAPIVTSFVFHDLHHRRAALSCFELADAAEGGDEAETPRLYQRA